MDPNDQSWTKCEKQIRGAMGCIANLAGSWPGGMERFERLQVRKIAERLSLLLEHVQEARTDGKNQNVQQRLHEIAEQLHNGEENP